MSWKVDQRFLLQQACGATRLLRCTKQSFRASRRPARKPANKLARCRSFTFKLNTETGFHHD